MIVRESPKARAQNSPQNWPPKSPHEALLSSPSGRRKYEQQRRQRSPGSPSPVKRRPLSRGQLNVEDEEEDEEDEEDEEMLQLKLEAIQAKLKLKKLQQKARKTADGDNDSSGISSRPGTAASSRRADLPRPQSDVQVPVSPVRRSRPQDEQKSPARVLLGIDKGLRAQDVSLKRASSFTARLKAATSARTSSTREIEAPRGKSFSERIADSRDREKERDEKQARIVKSRSRGFGLQNIEELKDRPVSRAASALSTGTRSSQSTAASSTAHPDRLRSRSINELQNAAASRPGTSASQRTDASRTSSAASRPSSAFGTTKTAARYAEIADRDDSTDAPSFESFSGLHLKSRGMQHNAVARTLEGKTVVTIPQLLKSVKAPEFDPPDMENDFVVMGVIASKSSPMTPKNMVQERSTSNQDTDAHKTNKFMIIKLVDLRWELDLFLFDTGFSQFWKLTVGTLIAVLNPEIMPPRVRDTGKFSLKLTSSDDTVLEIGIARDLDFCHAMRKDGKECGSWIDGRKTEFCDFHIELQVEKSKRGRMEINTMTGFGKGTSGTGKGGMFGPGKRGPKRDELRIEGKYHDSFLHETMWIAPGAGGAARLLDHDEQSWDHTQRAERHRKQLADKEKERELAKKLGDMGSGAGSDYMRHKGAAGLPKSGPTVADDLAKAKPNESDFLGLLDRKAEDVSLAPTKRKRDLSGKSAASAEPVGWGGAFKRGLLLSPTKKDNGLLSRDAREVSPAKKRARLLLPEKGIREPGRDSLGTLDVGLIAAMDDDDDDDLEVV